jgi:hypothetical protein
MPLAREVTNTLICHISHTNHASFSCSWDCPINMQTLIIAYYPGA